MFIEKHRSELKTEKKMGLFSNASEESSIDQSPPIFSKANSERGLKAAKRRSTVYLEEIIEEEEEYTHDYFPERTFTICFDDYDDMQTTIHINDYTDSEIRKTWYGAENYDKMITSAQKTVRKVEEREEKEKRSGKSKSKKKEVINYRGLEAWTTEGSVQVHALKEDAVQAVWNEQSRQWEEDLFEPEEIREAYLPFSEDSLNNAQKRAKSDAKVYDKAKKKQQEQEEMKKQRNLLAMSKNFIGQSMKFTTRTTKMVGKTSMKTGQFALEAGKRTARASIGVATFDRRMVREAFSSRNLHSEVPCETMRRPSRMSRMSMTLDSKSLEGKSSYWQQQQEGICFCNSHLTTKLCVFVCAFF